MTTFTIGGEEHEVKIPEGRAGRRAVSNLIKRLTGKGSQEIGFDQISSLFDDDEFDTNHLPVLLGLEPEVLEEHGSFGEVLDALMKVIDGVFTAMRSEEVQAAEKK